MSEWYDEYFPELGNPFYNTTDSHNTYHGQFVQGVNGILHGYTNYNRKKDEYIGYNGLNVLPNCTTYANGRFNELIFKGEVPPGGFKDLYFIGNSVGQCSFAKDFSSEAVNKYYSKGIRLANTPVKGAIICWEGGKEGNGHVAVVEEVNPNDPFEIAVSYSGTSMLSVPVKTEKLHQGDDGNWTAGSSWMNDRAKYGEYKFNKFICPPNKRPESGYLGEDMFGNVPTYEEVEVEKEVDVTEWVAQTRDVTAKTLATDISHIGINTSTSLISYPTLVETPFILLKVGDFIFGDYTTSHSNGRIKVTYPNFINSLTVTKINGSINQYNIQLVYQIRVGDDPNLIDKIFSSIGYGYVQIQYGDWQAPNFIYREDSALITKLTSHVDFNSSKITYSLACASTAASVLGSKCFFPGGRMKPSKRIKEILFDAQYGLTEIFTGMNDNNYWNLVAGDDLEVSVPDKHGVDPLSYINFLVSCMVRDTNPENAVILDSSYFLTIHDDMYDNDFGGAYFTVVNIENNAGTIISKDIYEVDVGYPTKNMVTNFSVVNDNSYTLLYNYSDKINPDSYVYDVDNKGNYTVVYSPGSTTDVQQNITTVSQKTWWTRMTEFPIQATLTIKGLVRPAMLMTYVRINALFYGQKHISSGLYFVTKQVDKVDGSGYRTTLSLTRFAGDNAYTTEATKQETYYTPVVTKKTITETKLVMVTDADYPDLYAYEDPQSEADRRNRIKSEELIKETNSNIVLGPGIPNLYESYVDSGTRYFSTYGNMARFGTLTISSVAGRTTEKTAVKRIEKVKTLAKIAFSGPGQYGIIEVNGKEYIVDPEDIKYPSAFRKSIS